MIGEHVNDDGLLWLLPSSRPFCHYASALQTPRAPYTTVPFPSRLPKVPFINYTEWMDVVGFQRWLTGEPHAYGPWLSEGLVAQGGSGVKIVHLGGHVRRAARAAWPSPPCAAWFRVLRGSGGRVGGWRLPKLGI